MDEKAEGKVEWLIHLSRLSQLYVLRSKNPHLQQQQWNKKTVATNSWILAAQYVKTYLIKKTKWAMSSSSLFPSEGSHLLVVLFLFGLALFPLDSVFCGAILIHIWEWQSPNKVVNGRECIGREEGLLRISESQWLSCILHKLWLTPWPDDVIMGYLHLPSGLLEPFSPSVQTPDWSPGLKDHVGERHFFFSLFFFGAIKMRILWFKPGLNDNTFPCTTKTGVENSILFNTWTEGCVLV